MLCSTVSYRRAGVLVIARTGNNHEYREIDTKAICENFRSRMLSV